MHAFFRITVLHIDSILNSSLRSKSEQLIQAREEGKTAAEVAELVESLANAAIEEPYTDAENTARDKSSTMSSMLRDFDSNIETGFQLANQQGPLCAEPVVGMAYFVEKIEVADMAEQEDTREWRGAVSVKNLNLTHGWDCCSSENPNAASDWIAHLSSERSLS